MQQFVLTVGFLIAVATVQISSSDAACPVGTYNNKICSGYGKCNRYNQCECDSRHMGFDCSQHRCPNGIAWVAPARATDNAHYRVQCSNKGICDHTTGTCQCMQGFTGSACQRLACPEECNEAGECLSLKALSRMYAVASEPIYDSIWDADKIYGCKCRRGFGGYDCSKRLCPMGDDPMTTGQVNEVQVIRCTANGGYFYLYFNGERATVPFDATVDNLQKILKSFKTLSRVKVTYTAGTKICNNTLVNAVLIEFTDNFGQQPPFKVFNGLMGTVTLINGNVYAASGGASVPGRVSVKGTKEWAPCSNRGDCDESTGQCICFLNPMPGYRSSDGYGNPGNRGDCGCANNKNKYGGAIKACPGELTCSGHGYCTGSPSYKCICENGWTLGDCSSRTCPMGPSWFKAPTSLNVVHSQWATCSDAGICEPATGECQCYSPFGGTACEKMKCPGEPVCSGHGQCMSIRRLSQEADVADPSLQFDYGADPNNALTYDRYSIYGCKCDPGYQGYDCSQRMCPTGDDPTTTGQVDEVQVLKCVATGGTFQLLYRTLTSVDIPFDASQSILRDMLMTSFGFEDVQVEYSYGQQACSSNNAVIKNVIKLTFPLDHGDLAPLRPVASFLTLANTLPPIGVITTANNGSSIDGIVSQKGTKENAECSNKGICEYDQGTCKCSLGYGSSDGRGKQGNRNDCGYILKKIQTS